jgi:hypothetical protein
MTVRESVTPIDLQQIEAKSGLLEKLAAALRREAGRPRTSPFAASGAKPPPTAPPKRRR